MKVLTILLLTVAAALAIPIEPHRKSGTGGWYVPHLDGSMQWITEGEAEELEQMMSGRTATVVKFHLYTRSNPTTPDTIISGNANSVKSSHFNQNNPSKFIIHGWQSSENTDMFHEIRDNLLSQGAFNVFTVDWSDRSLSLNYITSKSAVPDVGQQVAGFIDFLYKQGGLSFNTLHLIGHSLGAHVAGYAGKNVVNGKIAQISGLDPALPLFNYNTPSTRLHENDASYVETIQTCGGFLGFSEPIGKTSFYPNGGKSQPGCGLDLIGTCAHSRSWMYFSESILYNNYPSVKCDTYKSAEKKSCGQTYSSIRMASPQNYAVAKGYFYVPVNDKIPFGMSF